MPAPRPGFLLYLPLLPGIAQNRSVGRATWDAAVVVALLGIIAALTWWHDPFRSYTAAADADLIYIYESLLMGMSRSVLKS